uniref:Uncharacterized protein n=1 Tax=Picea glauca TaxID=3330 RepID=A0A124GNF8_PICGL|nr:hypothetical protein ABT39_MTgene4711 [Picea glauca]
MPRIPWYSWIGKGTMLASNRLKYLLIQGALPFRTRSVLTFVPLPGSCFFAAPALACSYCFRFCVFPILLSRCSSSGISGLVRVLGIVPVPIPVPRRNEMRRIYCGF